MATVNNSDRLDALPARATATLLAKLHELRQKIKRGVPGVNVPHMSLFLRSGREVGGWLLDLADDRGESCVLLRAGTPTDRVVSSDIFYVAVRDIEAVLLRDVGAFVAPLSFGAVDEAEPNVPVPTKMELRRKAATSGESLAALLGKPLAVSVTLGEGEISDNILSRLDRALTLLGTLLREQIADELGREAFGSVMQIELLPAPDGLNVSLNGGTMRVAVPTRYSEAELKSAVLAVL
ncbi:MAG: hypothetical protein H7Y38_05690 [Armatimonadetes bacterium]|nr:hypothetical protein [Armatimonadota bacterium]